MRINRARRSAVLPGSELVLEDDTLSGADEQIGQAMSISGTRSVLLRDG
jgi:hypothetical protein